MVRAIKKILSYFTFLLPWTGSGLKFNFNQHEDDLVMKIFVKWTLWVVSCNLTRPFSV